MSELVKDDIIFNAKLKKVKKKRLSILDELDELENEGFSSLISSDKEEKPKKERNTIDELEDNEEEVEEFMSCLRSAVPKTQKGRKFKFDVDFGGNGKRKKKKKDKKGVKDYAKDFELEIQLLKNLQMDQDKFIQTLQKKYDQMENTKSTARGVGKYTTDLINAITTSRSTSLQIIDKIISAKKTVADLDFKERKEFGNKDADGQNDLANYASNYLKQMISAGRNTILGNGDMSIEDLGDGDGDELFNSIEESLGDTGRSEDVEKYLKYENDNIEVWVVWDDHCDDEDIREHYEFVALDEDGRFIPDYPLPEKTSITINRSTNIATDIYGNKYKVNYKSYD